MVKRNLVVDMLEKCQPIEIKRKELYAIIEEDSIMFKPNTTLEDISKLNIEELLTEIVEADRQENPLTTTISSIINSIEIARASLPPLDDFI